MDAREPMTEKEYRDRIEKIETEKDLALRALYREYAMSHVKYKIGDTIKDSRWAFVVDKITANKSLGLPTPVYHGYELKKDLARRKVNNNRVAIYGNEQVVLVNSAPELTPDSK